VADEVCRLLLFLRRRIESFNLALMCGRRGGAPITEHFIADGELMPIDLPRKCGTEDLKAVLSFALGGLAITLHLLHYVSIVEALILLSSAN
jgi:hypothetical protein